MPVTFDEKELLSSLDKEKRRTRAQARGDRQRHAARKWWRWCATPRSTPCRAGSMHVDFLRVDLDEEVQVTVPLVLTGKPVGVTNGGNLHQSMHVVPVAAKPAAIPTKLEVDVCALDIGDALHVSDLKLGAACASLLEGARRARLGRGAEGREGRGSGGGSRRGRSAGGRRGGWRGPRGRCSWRGPRGRRQEGRRRQRGRRREEGQVTRSASGRPCTSWLGSGTLVGSTRTTATIWGSWSPTSFWRGAAAPRRAPNLAPSSPRLR